MPILKDGTEKGTNQSSFLIETLISSPSDGSNDGTDPKNYFKTKKKKREDKKNPRMKDCLRNKKKWEKN